MVTEKLQINVWGFSVLCVLVSVYLSSCFILCSIYATSCMWEQSDLQPIIGPYLPRHLLASQLVPPVHIAHTLLYAVFCYVSFTL